jgi:D-arabinose 1-dehydrogenase-like Zn-dependent alcohol dehydrogenase
MKAARIVKPNENLQVEELETPKPKGSQVLVKVHSSGVCHSDIHLWEGVYQGSEGQFLKATDRGVKYPLTPGHKIAGVIDSLADQVEGSIMDLIELVSLAKRQVIIPIISNRFKLNQAIDALTLLKNGKVLGRGVINP